MVQDDRRKVFPGTKEMPGSISSLPIINFRTCQSSISGQIAGPEEKSSDKKEDKPGRADKYCYRICHHGKARQIEATKSKERGNAKNTTELQFREARKCHHRKTSEDFCVEKICFDYNKPALSQSVYTIECH